MKKMMIWSVLLVLLFSMTACKPQGEEMPVSMPQDFAIYFRWGIGVNEYDTYNGKLTKDLISAGSAETKLTVSQETLQEIYSQLLENDIILIGQYMSSENLHGWWEGYFDQTPCATYQIRFHINGKEYKVEGDETAYAYVEKRDTARRFCAFVDYMKELATNTEEYKSLPEAEGGYC